MLDTRGLVIGELAVREKLVTREQLDELLEAQEREGYTRPIGALMVEKKILTQASLDSLLQRQRQSIADYERFLAISGLFGRIALERCYITPKQLAWAIRRQLAAEQEGKALKIGQILLQTRILKPEYFWEILHAQGSYRCSACGHELDRPRVDGMTVHCEKCDKAVLSLDQG